MVLPLPDARRPAERQHTGINTEIRGSREADSYSNLMRRSHLEPRARLHHPPSMCGRARLATDYSEIRIEFRLDPEAPALNLRPSWNIPPTRDMVAIRSEQGRRRASLMRWGLIPHWAKEIGKAPTVNARADGLAMRPTLRGAWRGGRRCLVIADGFYGWRESDRQAYAVGIADGRRVESARLCDAAIPTTNRGSIKPTAALPTASPGGRGDPRLGVFRLLQKLGQSATP